MNIGFKLAPNNYSQWDLTRTFANILHSDNFAPRTKDERRINFQVKLNENLDGSVRRDGSGTLIVPSEKIGNKLLEYLRHHPLKIGEKNLKFFREGVPPKGVALTLEKTSYVNPRFEEERGEKLRALKELLKTMPGLRVDTVQFGIFYQPKYPSKDDEPLHPRAFSIEWEGNYVKHSSGWLTFEYDHKLIRITLGSELTESELTEKTKSILAISYSNIQKIDIGIDGKPYICFDTLSPPVMESMKFHRTMVGDKEIDNRNFKQRIGSLHPVHSIVAPYAPHLRVVLFHEPNSDTIKRFMDMCETAGIARNMIHRCEGHNHVDALANGFFKPRRLYNLHNKLATFEWPIAFQIESLLLNGLLHTGDIEDLLPRVEALCKKNQRRANFVGDFLRRYHEALQFRSPRESPLRCFERVLMGFKYSEFQCFRCCHVTFTPTRMILEGPYATQSNRVIREYKGYEDHFIRVDFRDEDRLQYRWDREVDGSSFVRERVGATLKQGFVLAGRGFEFLAYSSSGLREHSVWFMNPFDLPGRGRITSGYIRRSLGNFKGTKLLKMPSKYAARLAQAFTATDASIKIRRHEWEEVPDLGSEPYLFTDGVGTMSQELADRIFEELYRDSREPRIIKPCAYQIRFLGYKGVLAVDVQLDKDQRGIHMRLRPSMKKFDTNDDDNAPIEIAQAFGRPNTCYLNRPLVMLLEDVGVRKESFLGLQRLAVKEARTIDDSILQFNDFLASHNLGSVYRLRHTMGRLQDRYNMDFKSEVPQTSMDNPFFSQLRQIAMNDVLRDIRHSARIPVPDSYLLVGVADEGPAYETAGYTNVFKLQESQIYACIQKTYDPEPTWLEGSVSISRSPVTHPGDGRPVVLHVYDYDYRYVKFLPTVQRVRAIGKPPAGMLCLFSHLKNVVVLPSVGTRSLASCLGGGDVDGDMFSVICYDLLLPARVEEVASYESCGTKEINRDSTVEDICDFVVEYINSDVLGLLSDRLLIIADQSSEGMRDEKCIRLAGLCSQAVDYYKQGISVNLDDNRLPRTLIRYKPDWHAAEVVSSQTDYKSDRALGLLYQSMMSMTLSLDDPQPILPVPPLSDPITLTLLESVRRHLGDSAIVDNYSLEPQKLFQRYTDELRYICATHTLSYTPGVRLLEAEVVIGTILAKCAQKRWRSDRIYRMRIHASTLVKDIQRNLIKSLGDTVSDSELIDGLQLAWSAWGFSLRRRDKFGANSFGLIALGTVIDCLDELEKRD